MSRAGGGVMGGLRKDPSVKSHRLAPGTVRRVAAYGRPYRGLLVVFGVCIVLDDDGTVMELINPEIVSSSGEQSGLEGCLSAPGKWGVVTRPEVVKVRALDRYGVPFEPVLGWLEKRMGGS